MTNIAYTDKKSTTTNSTQAPNKTLSNNVSTTARQWLLLSLIERGTWVGTTYLKNQLQLGGFNVSIRTVQRDLVALAEKFLLEKNHANPQGWRWRDDAPLQSMPNMNLSQAVAFNMVQANLAHLLPPAILTELFPWFELASKQLQQNTTMRSWLDKVHIEPATQPLIPPSIDRAVKDNIYQAVFEQQQIVISYVPRGRDEAKTYHLNPLSVVQRGSIIYLLATKIGADEVSINKTNSVGDDIKNTHNMLTVHTLDINDNLQEKQNNNQYDVLPYQDIRFFTLHRCQDVEILDTEAVIPQDFTLKDYVETGVMGFHEVRFDALTNRGKDTKVTLTFTSESGRSLTESKLSEDQQLSYNDHGDIVVTATINLTMQLVWWLRGFGKGLLSAQPTLLYDVVREISSEEDS